MVFQRHYYPDIPGPRSLTSDRRQSQIATLLCERAVAARVRDLLVARGALTAPPAAEPAPAQGADVVVLAPRRRIRPVPSLRSQPFQPCSLAALPDR